MYADPIFLQPFSNREDFLLVLQLTDDFSYDTVTNAYSPISLTGTTLVGGPGGPSFTGNQWTVQSGNVVTASTTPITIPSFPFGADLTNLSVVVAPGQPFSTGQPITISDPSGNNTMSGYILSYTSSIGLLQCQIGVTFQFEIRVSGPNATQGYVPWYDFGVYPDYGPRLKASLGAGIMHVDVGIIQIMIPEYQFRTLGNLGTSNVPLDWAGTFRTGLTVSDSYSTRQVFIAKLPVLGGGVTL